MLSEIPHPTYSHITIEERRKIERWRAAKISVDVIAEKLGRHRSTIFRELKRNSFRDPEIPYLDGYYGLVAHKVAKDRRYCRRKLLRFPKLCDAIVERLKHGWSPEQISGRLKLEHSSSAAQHLKVCHETIYRYIHSRDGRAIKLWQHLPERRARRRPRYARKRHGRHFAPELSILHRPDNVRQRKQFGHWECDLIQFRKKFGKANVTSLVERISRFTVFVRNNDRQSRPVMEGLVRVLEALPQFARRSITFDRGTEFTDWPYLQAGLGAQTWFCDPQSPWQKGTVENTNRRARRWLSRDMDPLELTEQNLIEVCNLLNSTPRKCLGFKTPAEIFRQKIMAGNRRAS